METVIRSPQDGVVKKLAHQEGVRIVHFPYAISFTPFFFFGISVLTPL